MAVEKIPGVQVGGKITLLKAALANRVIGRINALSNLALYPPGVGKVEVTENNVTITLDLDQLGSGGGDDIELTNVVVGRELGKITVKGTFEAYT